MKKKKQWTRKTGRKSPTAKLLNWTPAGINMIYNLFFCNKHGKPWKKINAPASTKEFNFVFQLLKEDWCGLLELPTFVWHFVVPRSLHAQIRVHRHWSFFSESHQLMLQTEFANQGDYFHIPKPPLDNIITNLEVNAMADAQLAYTRLLAQGVLPSLARGVLPMHINLGLTAGCSLRSMFQVIVQRNCDILQSTYWKPLLKEMERELCTKIDTRFSKFFKLKPCDINNRCQSDIEQNLRIQGKDPHEPCEIYLRRFKK